MEDGPLHLILLQPPLKKASGTWEPQILPFTGRNSGKSTDFWGWVFCLFGFGFFTTCLQEPPGTEANPFSADTLLHCCRGIQGLSTGQVGGDPSSARATSWTAPVGRDALTAARPPHPSLLALLPKKGISIQNGSIEAATLKYACKRCHLEYNRCTKQRFVTRHPACVIYLLVPCPMHTFLPRNHTIVVDRHTTARNVGVLRWIAAKAATWKVQSQTTLGNEPQGSHYGWESSNRKKRRPSPTIHSKRDKVA